MAAMIVAAALSLPSVSAAQEVDDEAETPEGVEAGEVQPAATASVESPRGGESWQVRLERSDEEDGDHWAMTLRLREGGPVVESFAVPDWARPPSYTIRAEAGSLGEDDVVVLAEMVPAGDDPGSDSEVRVQVAVRGRPDGAAAGDPAAWNWEMIARTQYSSLDGGNHLDFRESDRGVRLIRTRREATSTFCGADEGEEVVTALFDPAQGRFVESIDLERYSKGARHLEASLPEQSLSGPFTRGVYQWYWASSDLDSEEDSSGGVVRPMALGDRRGNTAWRVDASDGLRGEFATANVSDALRVRALHIVPGFTRDESSYRGHRLPSRLLVSFSEGTSVSIEIPQVDYARLTARRGLVVELPEPVRTHCMSVALLESHPADQAGRLDHAVALSQLTPVTTIDAPTAEATARRIVDVIADEPDLRRRKRIAHLASGLESELIGAVEAALAETEGQKRRRVIPLLGRLPADRAVPILTEFMVELEADAVEYRAVKRSLAAHHHAAAEPLREMLGEMEPDNPKYIDIVRLLGRVGRPSDQAALVEEFGEGSRMVRNERIRAAAAGGEAVLSKLFAVVSVETSTRKRRDALKAIYLVGKRRDTGELISTSHSEALREAIRRAETRRTAMLAFRAARYFRVEGFVRMVERRFLDHDDPLVRKAAVSSLGRYPSAQARGLLESALEDRSPDVRLAAINAVGQREDRAESVDALLTYVRQETWHPGQQQGLDVLAEIEGPRIQSYFQRLIDEKRTDQVAVLAAKTLGRAERSIDPALAREIVVDETAPDRLRLEMVDLLGLDDSDRGEALLVMLLEPSELREQIDDDELRRRLERRALLSLGRRQSDEARERLLKIAKTGSDRKLRQHALRALAFYRGDELVETLEAWRPEAPPELRSTLDQTVQIIENRGAIESVDDQIESTMEAEEQAE